MRRLIDGSASVSVGGVGSHGGRKNPSHFVGPSPCGQGGSTLSATVASHSAYHYLLAVSGGMDSMCMADLFLQTLGADSFAIAHCNFSLRGEESDGDETLVREWAERNGVRLFVKRFDTVSYAQERGVSIEMAARDLRYGWFAQLCREHGFAALSVAHNANDNAETLILNLLRGTGLTGLHGMAEISPCPPDPSLCPPDLSLCHPEPSLCHPEPSLCHPERSEGSVLIFRPLLAFTRKQIEGYVLARRVPYRHDSSNFTSDYKRNRIRNEVFPIFEKINPSFIRTLNREIGYFSEAGSIVEDWCRSQIPNVLVSPPVPSSDQSVFPASHPDPSLCHPDPSVCHPDPSVCHPASSLCHPERSEGSVTISTAALLATPHWRYLLYHILQPYGFNAQTLAAVEDLLTSDRTVSGKRFESEDYVLLTCRDTLCIVPREESPEENKDQIMVVRGPGIYNFNGGRFKVEIMEMTPDIPLRQPQGTLILDADTLRLPFVCRRWRQGDWLIPFGMKGKKKISDLFADLKYDARQKDSAIIIVDTQTDDLARQQHVCALLGLRIDDRYKVSASTRTILRITVL